MLGRLPSEAPTAAISIRKRVVRRPAQLSRIYDHRWTVCSRHRHSLQKAPRIAFLPPQLHRYDNSVWQNYSAAYSILVFAVLLLRGRLGEHMGYAAATLSGHRVNGYPRILRLPSLMNSKDEIYKNPDPVWRRSNSPSQNSYREKTGSLPSNIPSG